jgi:galactonate dehydratase
MNIERIETFLVPPRWVFVRVEAGGLDGWGEASLEGHAEAVVGAFEPLRDRFLGADARRIEDIWQGAHRGGFYRGGPVLMSALSGLDQALWDLKGKSLGVPAWQLIGGRVRDRIACYAWIGGDRPHEVAEAAAGRRKQGFKAVKMNATAETGFLHSPKALDAVLERVAAVQAEGLEVGLDFHGRLHRPMAKQLVRLLGPLRPLFIEEPLLSENLEGLSDIKAQTSIPVALGERLYSRWDFKPILENGLADIIQPDLSHAGGISEVRRIAAMAEAYDVAVAPHCPLGPLALAACLQIGASTPNHVLQEMSLGIHYNQDADLLTYVTNPEVFALTDGMLSPPAGPGLGISVDEAAIRAVAANPHRWRNALWRQDDGGYAEW